MQIPVNWQQADVSTFSNQLPNNDRLPQLMLPATLQNNMQFASLVTGTFRMLLQNRTQQGPLYVVAYNIISSNGFQNQVYQQWCQKAVDLLGINAGQFDITQQTIQQTAKTVYECYLGFIWSQYSNQLSSMVNQSLWPTLQQAANNWQMMEQQINNVKQGFNQSQMHGYGNNMMQGHTAFANTVSNQTSVQMNQMQNSIGINNNNVSSEGIYAMTPVETLDSSNGFQSPQNNFTQQPTTNVPVMEEIVTQAQPEPVELIPLEQIVVDPKHYGSNGNYDYIKVNDYIYIEPTFKASSKINRSEDYPWPIFMDPNRYMSFTVTYPEGSYEKIVEITKDMEYLRHELNDVMRERYRKINKNETVVVPRQLDILEYDGTSTTDVETYKSEDSDLKFKQPLLVLENAVFAGTTTMEVEKEVAEFIKEKTGNETTIPCYEYISRRYHMLDVTEEGFNAISSFSSCTDFHSLIVTIKDAFRLGKINLRTFNFINKRLTKVVNEFIKDSLSDDSVSIDDFTNDFGDLLDYYEFNRPKAFIALEKAVDKIISRSVSTIKLDDGFAIYDEFVNLQTHWLMDQLSSLDLKQGECAFVGSQTNSDLLSIVKDCVMRNRDINQFARIRLITNDGYYLELVKGHLVDNANLLKLL